MWVDHKVADCFGVAAEGGHLQPILMEGEQYYLRSVASPGSKEASHFPTLFPELAEDVILPELNPEGTHHSSVLRISSQGSSLWMHYDTMDNFLVQVGARVRLLQQRRETHA